MRYLKHAAVLAVALAAFMASAAGAMAAPAPGYEDFADCPDRTVDADIVSCFRSDVSGGHIQMGSKTTPITDPITLVGSLRTNGDLPLIVGNFDGGRQQIPGGLHGITGLDWLTAFFPLSVLNLYAESELAGTPSNPLGPVFNLPLKVHLDNVLLSDSCYIGADNDPIALSLTSATTHPPPPNQSISGQAPTFGFDPELGILLLTDSILVDNAFAAPAARGCDLLNLGLVDVLVNSQAGLPSPAGTNEAIEEADAKVTSITNIFPPDGID